MSKNKKSLVSNYIFMVIYQLLSIVVPLITSPYLARALGVRCTGIYSYTSSIFNWVLLIANLGISTYAGKELAKVQDDRKKLSKAFSEIFLMQIIFNSLVTIIYYVGIFILKPQYTNIYYLLGITLLANIVNISWLYTGIEDFKKISIRGCIIRLLSIFLVFIFVNSPDDLLKYVLIISLTQLISNIYLLFGLTKNVTVSFKEIKFNALVKHFKANFILFIPQIAISIYALLDQPMIGWLSGSTDEVGFYQKAEQIVKLALYLITTIGTIMMPRIANLYYNKNKKEVKKYLNNVVEIVLYLAFPLMFGFIATAPFFVNWFLTSSFSKVGLIIMTLSPIIVFISLTNVIGIQYLLPTDKTKEYTTSVIIGAVVNFTCNLFLIPYLKSLGAAIATVIAEASVFLYQYYKIKDLKIFNNHFKTALKCFFASLIMAIIIYLIGRLLGISPLTTIIQLITGIVIYFILIKIMKLGIQQELIDTVINKFKRRKNI